MNIPELLALAAIIKNETGVDKNTATRIGTLFDEIIKKITEGGGGGEGSGVQIITIDALSDLDLLPQGVYLINGAAEGLLVVVDTQTQSDYTIETVYSNYITLTSSPNIQVAKSVLVTFKHLGVTDGTLNKGLVYPDDGVGFPLSNEEVAALTLLQYNDYFTRAMSDLETYISTYKPNYVGIAISTEGSTIIA